MKIYFLPNKENLTIEEVAEFFTVKPRTISNWIKLGDFEIVKVKRSRFIIKKSLISLVNEMLQKSKLYVKTIDKEQMLKKSLNNRVSTGINGSLRQRCCNINNWEETVGYNAEQLKRHLENQFTDGMDWDKFLNGEIHIDHIIPKAVFNFSEPSHYDFKRCWSLENLQPLWASDNIRKKDKLTKHFQPSLKLSV